MRAFHQGDVGLVPIPDTIWPLASGLFAFAGLCEDNNIEYNHISGMLLLIVCL
jgi:hypothetical protein